MRPEPGDIVHVASRWDGNELALVINVRSQDALDIRWLEDGRVDIAPMECCRIAIKRYHILMGVSVASLREDLHELNMRVGGR